MRSVLGDPEDLERSGRDAIIEEYGCHSDRVMNTGAGSHSVAKTIAGKRCDGRTGWFVRRYQPRR